jgi:BirA family biotin operon repressor/biotin-[acetyl-CoA-carboxylase] ligase
MKVLDLKNPFGAPIYHEETVSSTMDIARILAQKNEAHGTVINADFQEAGRGRIKRPWLMERGKNLMFTILLRYGNIMSIPEALTLKTGLAVSLAVEDIAPPLAGQVLVKWPNDVMIASRKMQAAYKAAGILTEGDGNNVFIGVGVNVAQREFPEEYKSKALSIIQAFPDLCENARFVLLEKILYRLHEELESGLNATWHERIIKRLYKKGETVIFAEGAAGSGHLVEGILSGLTPSGELLIIPKGEKNERAFITGELRVYES